MDPIEELDTIFKMIGITDDETRATIIAQEGFAQLEDLATLVKDRDVDEMAKRMAGRMQAEDRVLLGTVVIQHMKTLVWWVADQMKCGIDLITANFTPEVMTRTTSEKILRKELVDKELAVKDLGKFDPDNFNAYEDAFFNFLGQT